MGGRAGKIDAPVKPLVAGEEVENFNFEITPELLNWRKYICEAKLVGFVREVAASSEIAELDESHVVLRPQSQVLVNAELTHEIARAVSETMGHPFKVIFSEEERRADAVTVSRLEARNRHEARQALVAAFRSDPIVQKFMQTLNATLIESSVVEVTTEEEDKK